MPDLVRRPLHPWLSSKPLSTQTKTWTERLLGIQSSHEHLKRSRRHPQRSQFQSPRRLQRKVSGQTSLHKCKLQWNILSIVISLFFPTWGVTSSRIFSTEMGPMVLGSRSRGTGISPCSLTMRTMSGRLTDVIITSDPLGNFRTLDVIWISTYLKEKV